MKQSFLRGLRPLLLSTLLGGSIALAAPAFAATATAGAAT
ncbi:MAG: hypothetical protein JWR40_2286, partial [Massilia sp.]|nr:hypothetical protein [Massilia sp.]